MLIKVRYGLGVRLDGQDEFPSWVRVTLCEEGMVAYERSSWSANPIRALFLSMLARISSASFL